MDNKPRLTDQDLVGFHGADHVYRHPVFGTLYTEGVQFIAEKGGAYWLLDVIFSHQSDPKARAEEFQVWTLKRTGEQSASVTMTDGDTDRPIIQQIIEYTDFPLLELKLYFENDTLCLPSER